MFFKFQVWVTDVESLCRFNLCPVARLIIKSTINREWGAPNIPITRTEPKKMSPLEVTNTWRSRDYTVDHQHKFPEDEDKFVKPCFVQEVKFHS